jgi:hypothetical protein
MQRLTRRATCPKTHQQIARGVGQNRSETKYSVAHSAREFCEKLSSSYSHACLHGVGTSEHPFSESLKKDATEMLEAKQNIKLSEKYTPDGGYVFGDRWWTDCCSKEQCGF